MVMAACGTFDYVVDVPEHPTAVFDAQLRTPVVRSTRWSEKNVGRLDERRAVAEDRLVGYEPTISIAEAGITPDGPASDNRVLPKVSRSRITINATTRTHARVKSATFHVDSVLPRLLRPRDRLFLARTHCAGIGLSILRGERLVVAVGVVPAVPLGVHLSVHTPTQMREAERLFHHIDPDFHFHEMPVQIGVDGETCICFRARRQMGDYLVWVEHGFISGVPGTDMCVAIALKDECPDVAAIASAQLLDSPYALLMAEW